jgi:hypothetical protein
MKSLVRRFLNFLERFWEKIKKSIFEGGTEKWTG